MSYLEKEINKEDQLIKATESGDYGLKLLFLGLAQTGKSSIIQVIFEDRPPETTKEILATLGVRRKLLEFSNLSLNVYDVGGQITYLEEAFIDLRESIFSHIKTLFYVVDASKIQDFEMSKNYFNRAIRNLSEYSPEAKMFVLCHKSDLIPDEERQKALATISELFELDIYPNVEIHETSIYEASLYDAIEKALK